MMALLLKVQQELISVSLVGDHRGNEGDGMGPFDDIRHVPRIILIAHRPQDVDGILETTSETPPPQEMSPARRSRGPEPHPKVFASPRRLSFSMPFSLNRSPRRSPPPAMTPHTGEGVQAVQDG